jgi:negative regulator of sigma E activity
MMRLNAFFLVFATAMAAQDSSQQLPSADDVVAQMIERDNQRQAAFHGYTAARRYVLENSRHHKRAEMLVTVKWLDNGSKQFQTVSASGWGAARSHVFPKLLESESEASLPGVRERSRITPENYSFEMLGRDYINQRPAYVIAIAPKTRNKYLVQARVWVDSEEYAIVRIEGKPARSPSFWIKSVHFVHTYQKSGLFWLPVSDRSVSDARIVGATELNIEYFDYAPGAATLSAFHELTPGSVP